MSKGIKAYIPSISENDPKSRKPANEVNDWCKGEGFKLWSTITHASVPSLELAGYVRRPEVMPAEPACLPASV